MASANQFLATGGATSSLGRNLPRMLASSSMILIKQTESTTTNASNAAFWTTANGIDDSQIEYSDQQLIVDTTSGSAQKEISNITGSGVLTHVISPSTSGSGVQFRVRVVADGDITVIDSPALNTPSNSRIVVGGFVPYAPTIGTSSAGIGSSSDVGWMDRRATIATPSQALSLGIGLTFNASLVVTVETLSGSFATDATLRNSYVAVANYIPIGFERD